MPVYLEGRGRQGRRLPALRQDRSERPIHVADAVISRVPGSLADQAAWLGRSRALAFVESRHYADSRGEADCARPRDTAGASRGDVRRLWAASGGPESSRLENTLATRAAAMVGVAGDAVGVLWAVQNAEEFTSTRVGQGRSYIPTAFIAWVSDWVMVPFEIASLSAVRRNLARQVESAAGKAELLFVLVDNQAAIAQANKSVQVVCRDCRVGIYESSLSGPDIPAVLVIFHKLKQAVLLYGAKHFTLAARKHRVFPFL